MTARVAVAFGIGRYGRRLESGLALWLASAVVASAGPVQAPVKPLPQEPSPHHTSDAKAPDSPTADLLRTGQAALAGRRIDAALASFERGYREAADADTRLRFLFYRAVALQQQAQPHGARGPLEQAVPLYLEYLTSIQGRTAGQGDGPLPDSGVAHNNLARALEDLGQLPAAADHLRRAIALRDSRRLFYQQNYARVLEKAGDWPGAAREYRSLVKEEPSAEDAHAALLRLYLAHAPGELTGYLWELLQWSQPERACRAALEALSSDTHALRSSSVQTELLTIVAVGSSRTGNEADRRAVRDGLQQLARNADGRCAGQLASLLETPGSAPDYSCWFRRVQPKPPRGLSPAEGFQALARAIGTQQRLRGNLDGAARYFRIALDTSEGMDVDPVAFEELVRVELARDDVRAVERLAQQYERSMFESKALAYAERQDERIFEFHRALGETYAVLGMWGDSSQPQSATFQLEHARATSLRLEQKRGSQLPEEYHFSPEATDLLARSYEHTGRRDDGLQLRIEQAERYQRAGKPEAAEEVLAPVRQMPLPPEYRQLLEKLDKVSESAPARSKTEVLSKTAPARNMTLGRQEPKGSEPLTPEQEAEVKRTVLRFVEQAAAGREARWSDAPQALRAVHADASGYGTLTLEIDGRRMSIPFKAPAGQAIDWER